MSLAPDHVSGGVAVTATARLHLGFLDLEEGRGRRFGSIGVSLDRPSTRLVLQASHSPRVDGPEAERAGRHLLALERELGLSGPHRLRIEAAIPSHAGLGSGTQLALAIAAALRRLHRLSPDVRGDAALLARGARSGVGIGLFETGGLLVDGGAGPHTSVAPIIARMAFPSEWRVVLVLDRARRGLHGGGERQAFRALAPMTAAVAGELCRLVLMQALPALAERNIEAFGAAIATMQARLGDHFAPHQGGRFTSPQVEAILERLDRAGARGIGQSSWGPTGFAFAASAAEAERLAAIARGEPAAAGLDIDIAGARNRGAEITAHGGEISRGDGGHAAPLAQGHVG